jgi:hypothetical protein
MPVPAPIADGHDRRRRAVEGDGGLDGGLSMKHAGIRAVLAASMLGAALAIASLPGATLAKDGDIIRTGSCTGGADWKLKLSPEDGKIEVEFEVDQNQNGKTWNVRLKRDGNLVAKGQRTTQAPSGSFEFRRVISDGPGADHIKARARQLSNGQVCVGTATFPA